MATNNIKKLYELAKVEKEYYSFKTEKEEFTWELNENGNVKHNCIFCGEPEIKTRHFTPANQLELIKWLASEQNDVEISWYSDIGFRINNFLDSCEHKDFSQALAGLVCQLWEDLTPEQREEVRGILE